MSSRAAGKAREVRGITMRVELRPSIAADFLILQGTLPTYRSRCLTAVVDGRVIGIGGLVHLPGGEVVASVLMSQEARKYPVAIHRAGLAAIAQFRRLGLRRVLAQAQPGKPSAERWLMRLGFEPVEIGNVRMFVWQREVEPDVE